MTDKQQSADNENLAKTANEPTVYEIHDGSPNCMRKAFIFAMLDWAFNGILLLVLLVNIE